MRTGEVCFASVEEVQRFVSQAERETADVDVSLGSCMVDGKSLLGVLSFGIGKRLVVTVHDRPKAEESDR